MQNSRVAALKLLTLTFGLSSEGKLSTEERRRRCRRKSVSSPSRVDESQGKGHKNQRHVHSHLPLVELLVFLLFVFSLLTDDSCQGSVSSTRAKVALPKDYLPEIIFAGDLNWVTIGTDNP